MSYDQITTEQLAGEIARKQATVAVYEAHGAEPPAELLRALSGVRAAFKQRVRDDIEAQLARAKNRLEGLKTPDQKRADAEAEVERLTKALG